MARSSANPKQWGKQVVVLANGAPVQRVPVSLARRFHLICMAVAAEVAAGEGLTALQLGALTYLSIKSGLSQNDLGARLGIDRSNTSLLVDELEKQALIKRHVDDKDRRAKLIYLTRAGTEVRDRLRPKGGVAQARILEVLPSADRERFLDMLIEIIDANERYVRPGAARRKPSLPKGLARK